MSQKINAIARIAHYLNTEKRSSLLQYLSYLLSLSVDV